MGHIRGGGHRQDQSIHAGTEALRESFRGTGRKLSGFQSDSVSPSIRRLPRTLTGNVEWRGLCTAKEVEAHDQCLFLAFMTLAIPCKGAVLGSTELSSSNAAAAGVAVRSEILHGWSYCLGNAGDAGHEGQEVLIRVLRVGGR